MIMGLQSLTLKCIARVFSLKNLLIISWVMWAYIVCVKIIQVESFADHSRVGQVVKWLVKYSPTMVLSASSMRFSRGLSRIVHSWASHEQVVNFTIFTILHQTFTLNPYIKSHKHTWKWLDKIQSNLIQN